MPLRITVGRSQRAEYRFGLHRDTACCFSSTETGPSARTFLGKGTEEDEGVTHGAYKADHMSEMQRFQFAEFKASNMMLNGARTSREVMEGLVED